MQRILLFILFTVLVANASARNISLADIARQLVLTLNKKDTTPIRKVMLNYSDYQLLFSSYLQKFDDTAERASVDRQMKSKENDVNRYLANVPKSIWFTQKHLEASNMTCDKGFRYLNYAYRIDDGFRQGAQTAMITVYLKCDTSYWVLEGVTCYLVQGNWKLFKVGDSYNLQLFLYKMSGRPETPKWITQYTRWSKDYADEYNGTFPGAVAANLLDHIVKDDTPADSTLLFTRDEFMQRYRETTDEVDERSAILAYSSTYRQIVAALDSAHASLIRFGCTDNRSNAAKMAYTIDNVIGGNMRGGGNKQVSLTFKFSCTKDKAINIYVANSLLVKLKGRKYWKVAFADGVVYKASDFEINPKVLLY